MGVAAQETSPEIRNWPLTGGRENNSELIVVGVLTVIGFALRYAQLHTSIIGDEVATYQDVIGRSFGSALTTIHTGGENSPPLFFLLAWASAKFGDPTVWIRVPSLILATATVPVIYLLGRESVGRIAGLIGAATFALSPYAIFYGSEARPYATMTFFVALSTLGALRAVRTGERRWWLLYALSAAAAAYSHYTAIFLLGVQAAWSFWACRSRLREPLIANAFSAIIYVPWLFHVRGKKLGTFAQLYPLNLRRALTDPLRPVLGHPWAPLRTIPTKFGLAAVGLCVLAGLVALVVRRRNSGTADQPSLPPKLPLLMALAAATPVGLLLYSLLATDIWLPRGLSASEPATVLVVGALLVALPRRLAIPAVIVLAVTLVTATVRNLRPAWDRGPYREIASYLDKVAGRQDPVTLATWPGDAPIRLQFHKPHPIVSTAEWGSLRAGGRAYMILDGQLARLLNINVPTQPGYQYIGRRDYGGGHPTEVFAYRRL